MSDSKPSSDPRFSGIGEDPKFRSTKAKDIKIKLDDRFSKKDLEVKRKAKVDKYGRKIKDSRANEKELEDFDKYFEKDDVEEEKKNEEDEEDEEAVSKLAVVDRARGELPPDYVSSSDEYTSSDSDTSGSEFDSEEESEIEEYSAAETGEASNTLAVVNLDWDHVKSTDLMITFSSFVPKGGKIEKICIYPSEFGKERMKREEVEGPPKELFQKKKNKKKSKHVDENDSDDSDVDIKDLYEEGDAEKDVDSKALRQYQLDRLRYYYAVVYCNNIDTARAIYENCDATEYESTANMFDIRYVPGGMEFDDEARDECDSLPKNYTPLKFSTDALQHSNVKLTWDETPADRVEVSKRAFSQKEIDDMDFKAYLASDSDESEEEVDDTLKNKLKALAGSSLKMNSRSKDREANGDAEDGEEEGVDMEITFTPGLDENEPVKEATEESTIEKIRRKEKERRKARKEKVKQLKHSAEKEKRDKLKSLRNKKHDNDTEIDTKSKAELELLMMDDDEEDGSKSTLNKKAHFNMNEILRSEKEKKKKSKYQDKKRIVEDEFKPDLNDPRFNEVFEDRAFAIDPSQPEFKGTAAMKEILNERSKRAHSKGKTKSKFNGNNKKRKHSSMSRDNSNKTDEKKDIANIVSKLKKQKGKK